MTARLLINRLEALIDIHGDLPICFTEVEMLTDTDDNKTVGVEAKDVSVLFSEKEAICFLLMEDEKYE